MTTDSSLLAGKLLRLELVAVKELDLPNRFCQFMLNESESECCMVHYTWTGAAICPFSVVLTSVRLPRERDHQLMELLR